jgi:GntR family transcriptional regulator, transcriptional repressor for pyruvate dehydrogenase complex
MRDNIKIRKSTAPLSSRKSVIRPAIRPVNKTVISEEIVEQILGLIEKGELKPGQRLPSERDLCVQFGSGRSSLREALRCLSMVGVLHARVGEGTKVAPDSGRFLGQILKWRFITEQQNIENLMQVRIALESLTAASVATNRLEEDLRDLDELLTRMKAAQNDARRFGELDLEFHLTLARASGNTLVVDLITMIRGQVAKALSRALTFPDASSLSLSEHIRIVQKIRRSDSDGARAAMYEHLQSALERYRKTVTGKPRANNSPSKTALKAVKRKSKPTTKN